MRHVGSIGRQHIHVVKRWRHFPECSLLNTIQGRELPDLLDTQYPPELHEPAEVRKRRHDDVALAVRGRLDGLHGTFTRPAPAAQRLMAVNYLLQYRRPKPGSGTDERRRHPIPGVLGPYAGSSRPTNPPPHEVASPVLHSAAATCHEGGAR